MNADTEADKARGNEAFARGDTAAALECYNRAISVNPNNHVYYSNRAACYAKMNEHAKALEDSQKCISLNPSFVKGYWRGFTAATMLSEWQLALSLVQQALTAEPNNKALAQELEHASLLLRLSQCAAPALARSCQIMLQPRIAQLVLQNERVMQSEAFSSDLCAVSMRAGEHIRCMRQIVVDADGGVKPFTSKEIGNMMLMPNQSTEQLSAQVKQGKLMFVRLFLHYNPRTRQQEYAYEERTQGVAASAYDSRVLPEKAKLILDLTIAEVNAANPLSAFVEAQLGKSK